MSFLSLPILMIFLAMFSIQLGASFAKELFPVVGPIALSGFRLTFAALILLVIWRPWRHKLPLASYKKIALYGAALGFMNLTFYLALERIPLGLVVALEFTGPLAVSLLKSRKVVDFLWVLLAAVGIYLILPIMASSSPLDPVGIMLALAAGFFWALYILFGQTAGKSADTGSVTSIGMFFAAVVVLPFVFFWRGSAEISIAVIPMALLVAILSSALPYSIEMIALKQIPLKTFGILMSLEPATAALMGYFNLKEILTTTQIIAIVCIIVASLGTTLSLSKKTG